MIAPNSWCGAAADSVSSGNSLRSIDAERAERRAPARQETGKVDHPRRHTPTDLDPAGWMCSYLSGTVLIGLLANSLFGWQWADSIAALVVAGLAIREGVEAWRGDVESPVLVLRERAAEGDDDPPAVRFGCAQPPAERQTRQRRWQAFEEDYALQVERTDTRLVIHCANVGDSLARLRTLVDSERECCAFAQWDIDTEQQDLRLIVATAPGRVAGLNVG